MGTGPGELTPLSFYSEPMCPAFTVEGSTQENWPASPTGTTVTIECHATTHILVGSAALTCQEDRSWSSVVPQCDKTGELIQNIPFTL